MSKHTCTTIVDDVSTFYTISLLINIGYNIHDFQFFISNDENRFMDEWSSTLGHGSVYGFFEP